MAEGLCSKSTIAMENSEKTMAFQQDSINAPTMQELLLEARLARQDIRQELDDIAIR